MRAAVSVALAFLLSGISQVIKDLGDRPMDRRGWALQPTLGKAILVAATWWATSSLDLIHATGQKARSVAFGILGVIEQMIVLTGLIWICISAATHIFDSAILQVVSTMVFIAVSVLFVLPLANVIVIPLITLIVGWPLELLFPLKGRNDGRAADCCPNCKHYRRSRDFGDFMGGLCQSKTMPGSDRLPCSIALETSSAWERYYSAEPSSRPWFPNDCPFFERRATKRFSRWPPRG